MEAGLLRCSIKVMIPFPYFFSYLTFFSLAAALVLVALQQVYWLYAKRNYTSFISKVVVTIKKCPKYRKGLQVMQEYVTTPRTRCEVPCTLDAILVKNKLQVEIVKILVERDAHIDLFITNRYKVFEFDNYF